MYIAGEIASTYLSYPAQAHRHNQDSHHVPPFGKISSVILDSKTEIDVL